jgi:hypothetical protein
MDGVERKSPQKSWLRTSHSVYAAPARPGFLTTYIELFGIDRFGGWQQAQAVHFNDGGVFDQIYKPGKEPVEADQTGPGGFATIAVGSLRRHGSGAAA